MLLAVLLNGDWVHGVGYLGAIAAAVVFAGSPRLWLLRLRRVRQSSGGCEALHASSSGGAGPKGDGDDRRTTRPTG